MKKILFAGLLGFAFLSGITFFYSQTAGWNRDIDPRYTPEFKPEKKTIAVISKIVLEEYSFNGQHHKLEYSADGKAEYFGEWIPPKPAITGKFRVGRYVGHTNEVPTLSAWILSQGFLELSNPCPESAGYDVSVISITVIVSHQEKSITTCGSYPDYNLFHPIELTQRAIEDVATRINWQQQK